MQWLKQIFTGALLVSFLFFIDSCQSNAHNSSISSDSLVIAKGDSLFEKNCTSCHGFSQDGIGPNLSGVTESVSADWLHRFIKDPQQMIGIGDARINALQKKFRATMPSFPALGDEGINAIIAFLHTKKSSSSATAINANGKILADPLPEKIKRSALVVQLQPVTRFPSSTHDGNLPLTRITKLAAQPGTGVLFVNDLRGKLYRLKNGTPSVYMDVAKLATGFVDAPGLATGFGSFAFHPDFANNGLFYTTHTEAPGSGNPDFAYDDSIKVTVQWVLKEWKANDPAADTFSGTGRELLRINMPTGAHGVQEIAFNPLAKHGGKDFGLLYVCIGDGASIQEGYHGLVKRKDKIWGTILRLDPLGNNSHNGRYGIPSDNPFIHDNDASTLREIYALGFRNPHRITWSQSGRMFAFHIGQTNIEAIDWVQPGHDYGWPLREGNFVLNAHDDLNHVYPLPDNDSIYHITYPVAAFDHDEGTAITGGFEYSGDAVPQLKGKILFGDIASARLFYVNVEDITEGKLAPIYEWQVILNNKLQTLKAVAGTDRVEIRFGKDARGELYILSKADGRLYKMVGATTGTK